MSTQTVHFILTCVVGIASVCGVWIHSARAASVVSDDFNAYNLNTSLWTIVDPLGDAQFRMAGVNTSSARLRISVPAGTDHSITTDGINAARVMQSISNSDFQVEARFDSVLNAAYEMQGILVQQDEHQFIRSEFYHNGSSYYFYVGAFAGSSFQTVADRAIASASRWYMRITRTGRQWRVEYSNNGTSWQSGASFQQDITVTAVGPYAGNEGSPAPAFTCSVDYFFNTAQPIAPEDGARNMQDVTAPNLFTVATSSTSSSITATWKTDEPAQSAVEYGKTTRYESGTKSNTNWKTQHTAKLTGLQAGATYNIRINCTDQAGNRARSGNLAVVVGGSGGPIEPPPEPSGPTIASWYGQVQEFGQWGMPQDVANLLGNASSAAGIKTLRYSLNGGTYRTLSMGPNTMRLAQKGDFNIELPFSDLRSGANQVVISAIDNDGRESRQTVSVYDSSGSTWPLPYSIKWSNVSAINDVAQVTDGLWAINNGAVHPAVMAYDRLIAIGDRNWQDYEATVPITVHRIDPDGYAPPSYGPGVGLLLRWPGHSSSGTQPRQGVYPLGGIGMFRWTSSYERFEIFGNNGYILDSAPESDTLVLGVKYMFKVQVSDVSSGAQYRFKWWRSGSSEPTSWKLTGTQSSDPGRGCLLLLAHHVDASFGDVNVVPVQ